MTALLDTLAPWAALVTFAGICAWLWWSGRQIARDEGRERYREGMEVGE